MHCFLSDESFTLMPRISFESCYFATGWPDGGAPMDLRAVESQGFKVAEVFEMLGGGVTPDSLGSDTVCNKSIGPWIDIATPTCSTDNSFMHFLSYPPACPHTYKCIHVHTSAYKCLPMLDKHHARVCANMQTCMQILRHARTPKYLRMHLHMRKSGLAHVIANVHV